MYHSHLEIKIQRCKDFPESLTASKQERPRTHIDLTLPVTRVIEWRQVECQSTVSGVPWVCLHSRRARGKILDVLLNSDRSRWPGEHRGSILLGLDRHLEISSWTTSFYGWENWWLERWSDLSKAQWCLDSSWLSSAQHAMDLTSMAFMDKSK